ncbi:MAG: perosamine synthetase [Chloroflexota bacterium]|nr:perosamine synthetase [Chloroflexota bacterium]
MISIAKPVIGEEEKKAVLEVLDSGILAQGPRVAAFEKAFAEACGVKHAVATTSGTTALYLSLLANGIGEGDEVITSPFTFIASANSVLYVGAKPVFVDIDPRTFNIDASQIEAAITPKTKAIMPVHLYGMTADMDAIMAIAKKHNLLVIEDAAQAHTAKFNGKCAGSFGTGAFSLYPTKNMTSAEGGMVTTNDDAVAEEARVLRNHGMRRRYYHDELGYNLRMTDVHAAIGLAQLGKLAGFNAKRRENAAYYDANLKGVTTPYVPKECEHIYHQYTIRVPDGKRDALRDYLKENEIGSEIYYPLPINQQGFYEEMFGKLSFPQAEKAAEEVLSLPVHPSLSADDLAFVAAKINEFMA